MNKNFTPSSKIEIVVVHLQLIDMKSFVFTLCVLFACSGLNAQTNVWQPSLGHTQIPIWPGIVPDALPFLGPEYVTNMLSPTGVPWVAACRVSQPTMTVYSPNGTNTGVAVVVFPGGGYQCLAMDLEGTEICDWLTSRGIIAVLLKYRVPVKRVGPYGESPPTLEDAQRTVGLVRFHAAEWHIDPHKIGVIGFSAGGHMVAATSTHYAKRSYRAVDAADKASCRPDFAIACYPGHLWNDDEGFKLNPNVPVTTNTPPTFLLMAEDDHVDRVEQSLVYYIGLKQAGVPVEMHLYAQGGHAFGLRPSKFPITEWPQLVEKWLGTIGMTSE
jgi:acetyl esterase/lipase